MERKETEQKATADLLSDSETSSYEQKPQSNKTDRDVLHYYYYYYDC